MNIWQLLFVGAVGRVCLLVYGYWQDLTMVVKYTDVDYYVFTDAARFITQVILFCIFLKNFNMAPGNLNF